MEVRFERGGQSASHGHWARVAVRVGKRTALTRAVAIFAVAALLLLAVRFVPSESRFVPAMVALAALGCGFAGMSVLPAATVSDAIVGGLYALVVTGSPSPAGR